ncbi:toll/interleukin-1 receptor domain-containing protein [Azohydromonas caseinilytica]|uniref:Toll/interleukin-1 receptor domain-containing protein n=1 Tax=Azohydromonas caseinilytica TaxID=2728836 RepID=A0A848FGS2_9BURK|nr:toll/interleukin-1 receptor domain-containing protein [Azohydromonas caseinilytica]NML18462.1 toll/interleukin-1 receptor domain-containing protein [Azohydromonas caseinilytica]
MRIGEVARRGCALETRKGRPVNTEPAGHQVSGGGWEDVPAPPDAAVPALDEDGYFEALFPHIEEGRVIPVIGADLVSVTYRGRTVPLMQAVAERLLQHYGRQPAPGTPQAGATGVVLRPGHALNDAVCAVLDDRRRDPYATVQRALNEIVQHCAEPLPAPLLDLATVDAFRLFVTTTPDELLVRAIDQVRHGGAPKTREILHVPNLPTDEFRDLAEADLASSQLTAVLYLFGKARSAQLYAIHDEDTLEYVHNLQSHGSNVPERFIGKLRTHDLLLIGCCFPDWLTRFFLRLSNQSRLGDDRRPKREFLVGDFCDPADGLIVFLERFSRQTSVFRGSPQRFVAELARRWRARHPPAAGGLAATAVATHAAPQTQDTFFISYTRADFTAAQTLQKELRALGIDAVWFDHTALRPGHDWAGEIAAAIRRCYIFLPLISAQTEARDRGYFREEWTQAAEQARQIEGRPFIVPLVIDADYAGNADAYQLVPPAFLRKHFGHAPQGRPSEALRERLVELIRDYRLRRQA